MTDDVDTEWKFFDALLGFSRTNATVHSLLALWEHGEMPFDQWARRAILLFAVENEMLRAMAVELLKRSPPDLAQQIAKLGQDSLLPDWRPPAILTPTKLPRHEGGLSLHHNEHKTYYRTVAECVDDGELGYADDDWINEEQKQKAIASNDCWQVHWYPDTPVGSCTRSAADLDVLLAAVEEK